MKVNSISGKRKASASQNVKERDYWLKQLSGDLVKSFFPYDYNTDKTNGKVMEPGTDTGTNTVKFRLEGEIFSRLLRLSNQSHQRLFIALVAGLVVLLEKYTGNKNIIVGAPIYKQEIQGEFINTVLILVNKLEPGMTFKELILQVRQTIARAVENQNYPIEALLYRLNMPFSQDHFPLFDIAALLENIHDKNYLKHINRNMTVSFFNTGEYLQGKFEYNSSRYEKSTIERIVEHFRQLFRAVLFNLDLQVMDIDILPGKEKKQLLSDFNDTEVEYPKDKTIHELFESRAEKTPHRTAVIFKDKYLSYRELNREANQSARLLRKKGVKPDSIVAIILEPSLELLIGIFAILKAGGAYLPFDPEYPEKRILSILLDSGVSILLTREKILEHTFVKNKNQLLAGKEKPDILFLENMMEKLTRYSKENLTHINHPDDLLYLISTSGSTGVPKSLMMEHGNLMNLLNFQFFETTVDFRKVLQFASIGFDVSAQEIFSTLLSGGELYLIDKDMKNDVLRLFDLIRRNSINIVFWPPAFLKFVFSEPGYIPKFPKSIENIITAGERLIVTEPIRRYLRENHVYLHNHYGPAETHVVTTFTMEPTGKIDEIPPIGKPTANMKIYILDGNKKIKPVGTIGELYISGDNVGRGYINNPGLTAEKFVISHLSLVNGEAKSPLITNENPTMTNHKSPMVNDQLTNDQCPMTNDRFYRTGDLARWRPDGNIEFIGRADNQVKIRGFRIELGEIETRLMDIDFIKEAVVIDIKDLKGEKYLCAYMVSEKKVDKPELRDILSDILPGYMIPLHLVQLENIPLTPNGKVDKKALPLPEVNAEEAYIAPGNAKEKKLVQIWSEVLGIEEGKIGIQSDFFELGGHSLKATILITKIHKTFNVKVTLGKMFEQPTIRGLSRYIQAAADDVFSSIEPVEKKEYYPLSSAQKRLYILQHMEVKNTSYNNPAVVVLEGDPRKEKLENTLKKLIERHEALRTSFDILEEQPIQRVHHDVAFAVKYDETGEEEVENRVQAFASPFDLGQPPLLRVELIKVGEKHILMFDMHHIITDGTSLQVFTKEFMALYGGKELSPLRIRYKDFSSWQNKVFESGEIKQQQEYWLKQFDIHGRIPLLNIATDYKRPGIQSFEGDVVRFQIGSEETKALKKLAKEENATLYMVLLSIYNIFLSKISGQEDILVGTPTAGRRHADLQHIIGMFVNTLVMRNYPSGSKTFKEFLDQVKKRTLEAFENQDYQFEDLVEQITVNRDTSRNPLFDVMFALQNIEVQQGEIPAAGIRELKMSPYIRSSRVSKFDLTLNINEAGQGIVLLFEYCTKLFKQESIERFIKYFKEIVSSILKDTKKNISGIEIISAQEKKQVLFDFNNTKADYPKDRKIHALFEEQAETTPGNIAVLGPGPGTKNRFIQALTYRELNKKSNQLAQKLRKNAVKSDTIVAIMMERSLEMVIGIMAILKAGGAYLPIDPDYPEEMVRYMLYDAGVKVLIKNSNLFRNSVNRQDLSVLDFEHLNFEFVSNFEFRASDLNPAKLAYVLYTSGSTGKPKGVLIEHAPVVNILFYLFKTYPFSQENTYLFKTPYVFDVSVSEVFGWFLGGGRLAILENGAEKDGQRIIEVIKDCRVTHINFVPSMFRAFVDCLSSHPTPTIKQLSTLKYIFLAGEVLSPVLVNKFRELDNTIRLENIYGPTEGTIYAAKHSLDSRDGEGYIPIGHPLNNIKVYILNHYGCLQPVGTAGELCLSGAGLARGYLNRPELTAEKFIELEVKVEVEEGEAPREQIPNPKSQIPNKHMSYMSHMSYIYKTGDLARWLWDGNIEFLGRIDNQVKLRGYRIELGEIEGRLARHPGVKGAVVLTRGDEAGDTYLCAYIVPGATVSDDAIAEGASFSAGIREYLSRSLPAYMVPPYFVEIEHIPLMPNGKVDRRALPAPERKAGRGYIAPGGAVEEKLADLWAEVLGIKKEIIGINDNFFQLGGHSLKATILTAKIHRAFNVKFPLVQIFKTPGLEDLAKYIKNLREDKYISIEPVEKKDYYELSSAQKRLYLLQQMELESAVYNIPYVLPINTAVDKEKLEQIFKKLVARHESLRTSIEIAREQPVQKIHEKVAFTIEYYETHEKEAKRIAANFTRPFDLTKAPLMKIGLINVIPTDKTHDSRTYNYILLVDMHHIISDELSQAVLVKDFTAIANSEELPPLKLQYKDYSQWQNHENEKETIKKQEKYWLDQFKGGIPILNLPIDNQRPPLQSFKGSIVGFKINKEETKKLKMLESGKITLFMILLAIYNILLSKICHQQDIIIGVPIAGRRHADLENIIGMFVNMLALRNFPAGDQTFMEFLQEVKDRTLMSFENQDYPFDNLVQKLSLNRDVSRNPIFDTVFSFHLPSPGAGVTEPGPGSETDKIEMNIAHFELLLHAVEVGQSIRLAFEYCTDLFKKKTIEKTIEYYMHIVKQVGTNKNIKLEELTIPHDWVAVKSNIFEDEIGEYDF